MKVKAIRVHEVGGPEVLQVEEIELSPPGTGKALVRLNMAGINFIDIYFRRGSYATQHPYTPGFEGAGIVEAVGPNVTVVKPGDRVAFTGQPGAYAEAIIVDADMLIPVPERFSWEQAASFPLQGMTAHYLLHEFHTIQPGDVVLIHAAAGGMGLLLVQWAKHLGARVIGTVSTEQKAGVAKEAGADHVILYTKQDVVADVKRLTMGRGVDFIIDGVGKSTFLSDLEAIRIRGHIVVYGAASGSADPISPNQLMPKALTLSGGSLHNFMTTRQELLMRANAVIDGIQKGWLKLKIAQVLPLAQAGQAHASLESRRTMGKLLLRFN